MTLSRSYAAVFLALVLILGQLGAWLHGIDHPLGEPEEGCVVCHITAQHHAVPQLTHSISINIVGSNMGQTIQQLFILPFASYFSIRAPP